MPEETVIIDFESLKHEDGNIEYHGFNYQEDGFALDNFGSFQFGTFGTLESRFSGSTALFNNTVNGVTRLSAIDNEAFDLVSIDLTELNGSNVADVTFVGELEGGGTVSQTFSLDGNAFDPETFVFNEDFNEVVSVEWEQESPYHQFDNITIETDNNDSIFPEEEANSIRSSSSLNTSEPNSREVAASSNIEDAAADASDPSASNTTPEISRSSDTEDAAASASQSDQDPAQENRDSETSLETAFKQGEVIVQIAEGTEVSALEALKAELGATTIKETKTLNMELWSIDGDVEDTIRRYKDDERIKFIEPNYIVNGDATIPNDPSFNQLWGLNNTGQSGGTPDADIDAPEAWDIETGDNDVVVGVIDSGIDHNHPDLDDNMWVNTGEIAGNNIDDDNNGYVDDVHGYDFVNNDGDPFDDNSHGTHVAGTIAAEGDNGIGVAGVNWDAQLMGLKFLNANNSGSTFNAILAVEYATMMGADLTNNSWGGGGESQGLYNAIAAAGASDSLFVAAAGNNSSNNDFNPFYPATYDLDNIIAVASTDRNDNLSGFSNYGATSVDLGAPGSSIYSTVPGGGYATFNGTSMASPHVSGVAALLLAENPDLSYEEVKEIILDSADPIPALDGITLTGDRLNAFNAVSPLVELPGTHTVELDSGENVIDINFGNRELDIEPGSISGYKWHDLDGNGEWDDDEPVLEGWTIFLDDNENGELDEGETSTVTNNNGYYEFDSLDAGTYTVAEELQPGWEQTYPLAPGEYEWTETEFDWIDISDLGTPLGFSDDDYTEVALPFDFPFYGEDKSTVKISSNGYLTFGSDGYEYFNNPIPDPNDPNDLIAPFWDDLYPPSGGEVYYYYDENEEQFIVQYQNIPNIDQSGDYTFEAILKPDGSIIYQYETLNGILNSSTIGIENASGSEGVQISYNDGYAEEGLAVKIDLASEESQPHIVSVGSGENVEDINFGNRSLNQDPGSISGYKWDDLDGNGEWDENEEGLPDWTIYIDENENGELDEGETSTITDEEGYYEFEGLDAGSYTIGEVISDGWQQTYPDSIAPEEGETAVRSQSSVTNSTGDSIASSDKEDAAADESFASASDSKLDISDDDAADKSSEPSSNSNSNRIQENRDSEIPLETAFESGQVIVKPSEDADISSLNSLKASLGATTINTTQELGIQLWSINGNVEDVIARNRNNPLLEFIEPNYTITVNTTFPNDPNFDELWGLHNTGQTGGTPDADIDAPEAWDIQTGGNNVVVGVIDTGIDYTHPEIANNIWVNPGEIADNGIDDDENGYVDDVHGYDFAYGDSDPFDGDSHGTHVSGTIAAEGNNELGVVGVNWDADLMALKFLDDGGSGSTFNAILAIEYATMMGADLTNNSWGGGGFSQGLYDAIAAAGAADSLFIAAAGNDYGNDNDIFPSYPASYDLENIIAVASTDHNDNLSIFSNIGATSVDLGAPGSDIYSTVPGGGYASFNGTSMATPHVSGVAALVLAENPDLSQEEVKEIILNSADPIDALDGITVTGARLNAFNAISEVGVPGTHRVELDWGENVTDINFGNQQILPGSISGYKWNDVDGNGIWDDDEDGLEGWEIFIDDNENGELDEGETSTLTNENGFYSFEELDPETYRVAEIIEDGWEQTYPGVGAEIVFEADFSDDEGNPDLDGFTVDNTGAPDEGLWHLSTRRGDELGHSGVDSIYYGIEDTGNYDAGDTAGRIISPVIDLTELETAELSFNYFLETEGGSPTYDVARVLVSENGSDFIPIASNPVEIEDPTTGWTNATFDLSSYVGQEIEISFDFETNDDIANEFEGWLVDDVVVGSIGGDLYHSVEVGNGEDVEDIDFGNQGILPGSISGYKWNDQDGNGVWDDNEAGIEEWSIFLDENENGLLDDGEISTVTDAEGFYSFDDLDPETYRVAEELQDGWEQTYPAQPEVIFEADFSDDDDENSDLDGFTVDNTGAADDGLWHLSTRRGDEPGHSGVDSMYYGIEEDGNYDAGDTAGRIISPVIDLNEFNSAQLSFNYFLETEDLAPTYDVATLLISENGGEFIPIASNAVELEDPTTGWTNATFDLSSYVGQEIEISFDFATGDRAFNEFEGWYIDDVVVETSDTDPYHTVEVGSGENLEDINFGNRFLDIEPPLTIVEDDGTAAFAQDSEGTYWLVNNDTDEELLLENKQGTTYTDDTNNNWDGAAAEVDSEGGYRFLLEGTAARDGQAYVWSTDEEGVITSGSGWKSGDDLLPLESEFNVDLNDNGEIGSSQGIEVNELLPLDEVVNIFENGDGILS
ncbi:MAG: S8 family serine peptidase [Microcoleaceae cyanobacterium]